MKKPQFSVLTWFSVPRSASKLETDAFADCEGFQKTPHELPRAKANV